MTGGKRGLQVLVKFCFLVWVLLYGCIPFIRFYTHLCIFLYTLKIVFKVAVSFRTVFDNSTIFKYLLEYERVVLFSVMYFTLFCRKQETSLGFYKFTILLY